MEDDAKLYDHAYDGLSLVKKGVCKEELTREGHD
jgi:hypothetical protein